MKRLKARRAATMALVAWAALGAWAGTGYAQAKPVARIPLKPMPQAPANAGRTTMEEGGACASADPEVHCARFRNTTSTKVMVYVDGIQECLLDTPLRSAATGEILAPGECTRALKDGHRYEIRDLNGNTIRQCNGTVGQCDQQMAAEDAAAAAGQAANAAGNPSFNAPPQAAPAPARGSPAKGSAARGGGGGGAMLALVGIAGGAAVAAAVASKASAGSVKTLNGFCSDNAARPCGPCTCTTHAANNTCDTGASNNAACGGGYCYSGPGITHAPFC